VVVAVGTDMILVAGWKWCLRFNVEGFHTQGLRPTKGCISETKSTGVRKCRANRGSGRTDGTTTRVLGKVEGFYRLARRRFDGITIPSDDGALAVERRCSCVNADQLLRALEAGNGQRVNAVVGNGGESLA
jgi:hypothetical protein